MRRFLAWSVGAHGVLAAALLVWMLLPRNQGAALPPPPPPPENTVQVEVIRAPGTEARPPEAAAAPTPPGAKPQDVPPPQQPDEVAELPAPAPPAAAPEKPTVRVDLGVPGLTDEIRGEDVVPPGPDPTHQNVPPRYPRDAALRGEHGTVVLGVLVSPVGTVEAVKVLESSGSPSIDSAAAKAVERWRFTPEVHDGVAQESAVRYSFNFVNGAIDGADR